MKRSSTTMTETEQTTLLPVTEPEAKRVFLANIEDTSNVVVSPEMERSVKKWGVIEPPVLSEKFMDSHGVFVQYSVEDGLRRIEAARRAGLEDLICMVYPAGVVPPGELTALLNSVRSENPVRELQAIRDLEAAGKDDKEIARLTGMPVARIRKRKRLNRLIPEAETLMTSGMMRVSVAEGLADLPVPLQREVVSKARVDEKPVTATMVASARRVRAEEATPNLNFLNQMEVEQDVNAWREPFIRHLSNALAVLPENVGNGARTTLAETMEWAKTA